MGDGFRYLTALFSRAALTLCLPFLKIRPRRVLFQSYREKQYACNPKYICEALEKICPKDTEIAWSFREPEKFAFLRERGVRVLKAGSWEAVRYALTARVVCVNTYYKPTLPRRKGQMQMRTWHGGGAYKRVAMQEKQTFFKRLGIKQQLSGATLYLSSSRAFTQQTIRESFGFTGEVMEKGMPRNDILIKGIDKAELARVRREIGLKDGEQLVLYAPTYRDDLKNDTHGLDVKRLTAALKQRFGGEWTAAYRGHVFVKGGQAAQAKDLSAYPDMQLLLLAADALVTDYSSCMWDMSLTLKPVFLYCPDLDAYMLSRDFYTDIHTWPYPLARSNAELEKNISGFDEEAYRLAVRRHHEALGSCEPGEASVLAARRILKELEKQN